MTQRPLRASAEVTLGRMRSPGSDAGEGLLPYLRAANVNDGRLDLNDINRMRFDEREMVRYGLETGDVLVTEASGSRHQVGQTALVTKQAAGLMFQNTLLRLRPRSGTEAGFLYWWSRHAYASGIYAQAAQGLGIWHLGAERLRALPIPVYEQDEQRRITEFLDEQVRQLEEAERLREQQCVLLAERLSAAREFTFEGLSRRTAALRHVSHFFRDGDWIESPYITDSGIRLVQTGNVGVGRYRDQGFRYISQETFDELQCTEITPGDVLISRLSPPVGRACLAPDLGERMIVSVDIAIVRSHVLNHAFLVHYMSTRRHLAVVDIASRGATMARVSRSQLGSFRVPVIDLADQRRLAADLNEQRDDADLSLGLLDRSLSLLKERKRALISAAITGQLDVTTARSAA